MTGTYVKLMRNFICLFSLVAYLFVSGCEERIGGLLFPDLNPSEVDKVILRNKQPDSIRFEKLENGSWYMINKKQKFLTDSHSLYVLLKTISDMRYAPKRSVDKRKALSYKECSGVNVLIQTTDSSIDFSVKKPGADYDSSYLLLKDQPECILAKPYIDSMVNYPLKNWIKKELFDIKTKNISSLSIKTATNEILMISRRKNESDWIDNHNRIVKKELVRKIFNLFVKFRICDARIKDPSQQYGLKKPKLSLIITDSDGKPHCLFIGNRKNNSYSYIRRNSFEDGVLLFSHSHLRKLQKILDSILSEKIDLFQII